MNVERGIVDDLEGLEAKILALDPSDREDVVQVGAALEQLVTEARDLSSEVQEALGVVLAALESVYEDGVSDRSGVMDAVATAMATVSEHLRDADETDVSAVREAAGRLRARLASSDSSPAACEPEPASSARHAPPSETDPGEGVPDGDSGSSETPAADAGGEPEASPRLPEDSDLGLLREFGVESLDHIAAAEAALLELESNPDDAEQVNTIFRAFHTIKGTSGFLGLDRIQKLAHLAENLLDRARDGQIRIVGGYADLALSSCDALRTMIEGLECLSRSTTRNCSRAWPTRRAPGSAKKGKWRFRVWETCWSRRT